MSYNINLQHIIFRTKHSEQTIPQCSKTLLLAYINTVSQSLGVRIYRINAWRNHVHILADLPVNINLPDYVRKIKSTSSAKLKGDNEFPLFKGWATGYGSFSVSHYERDRIINYIKSQEEHHHHRTFAEELEELFGKDFIQRDTYWQRNWED